MTKTDNEKYVKRGADMFIEYNPEWEGEVSHANKGKAGAPIPVLGDADHAGRRPQGRDGARYGQLGGTIGKMSGSLGRPPPASSASGWGGLT